MIVEVIEVKKSLDEEGKIEIGKKVLEVLEKIKKLKKEKEDIDVAINRAENNLQKLVDCNRAGEILRKERCSVKYNHPVAGEKTYYSLEDKKWVGKETMTEDEKDHVANLLLFDELIDMETIWKMYKIDPIKVGEYVSCFIIRDNDKYKNCLCVVTKDGDSFNEDVKKCKNFMDSIVDPGDLTIREYYFSPIKEWNK
ncbi:MAG: hypothetical protein A2V66_16730 [Ignavibacteria bacterium RBG_13_36_8]|nr:MAG: hypothetical protein A2V66_16730 [Ignavibacteria bacterium RBG_13_36_8]